MDAELNPLSDYVHKVAKKAEGYKSNKIVVKRQWLNPGQYTLQGFMGV